MVGEALDSDATPMHLDSWEQHIPMHHGGAAGTFFSARNNNK